MPGIAPTDEALKFDVQATKDLGFNMIRKHVKVEPQRWYYHADKLGMLVWQDMPSMAFPKFFISDPAKQQFEAELEQMIDEHENSPSIVSWIPFNEGWGQYDVARITEAVDRRDPSRLSNGNSGAANCCNATEPGNGDLIDEHIYIGPSSPNPTPSRAAVLGEYGFLTFVHEIGHALGFISGVDALDRGADPGVCGHQLRQRGQRAGQPREV